MNNILITSAGKRVVLIKIFQKSIKINNLTNKIFTTDMNPKMAPAGIISDKCFKVPCVTDDNYITSLLEICLKNSITIIIPTIDTELLVLAENKNLFERNNIHVIVSDKNFIKACGDKRNTNILFKKLNIKIPKTIDKYHPTFPMFAKPYDGSLSKDLHTIHKKDELTNDLLNNSKLLFMEYIDKTEYKEFTVDMYYGMDNKVKGIVPRERIEIRAGEINKGITRKNYLVGYLRQRMNYLPGVIGCICIQLFYKELNNDVIGIEINPRFGGGYPLSYYAKANFPLYIIQEYIQNKKIKYSNKWLGNTLMLRYDNDIIVYDQTHNI